MIEENSLQVQTSSTQKSQGFLYRLAEIFADEKVKSFFKDYFSTWTDAKTTLMMMHTLVVVDEGYFQAHGKRLSSHELSETVRQIVSHKEYRLILVDAMKEFMRSGEDKMFSTFQRISSSAAPQKETQEQTFE